MTTFEAEALDETIAADYIDLTDGAVAAASEASDTLVLVDDVGQPLDQAEIDSDSMPRLSEARAQAVIDHVGLVNKVLFQVAVHFPNHVDKNELRDAGKEGLVEAAIRYDESRGVPFERFAAQRIRGAMLDQVRRTDWAPRSVRRMARKIEKATGELAAKLERMPSEAELAERLDMSKDKLAKERYRQYRSVQLSLDYEVHDGEDELTLEEVVADEAAPQPEEAVITKETLTLMHTAIELLPPRHRHVIVGYFLEGKKSEEVAAVLGVTESRVSQLRSEALALLRYAIEAQQAEPVSDNSEEVVGIAERRRRSYASEVGRRARSRLNVKTSS